MELLCSSLEKRAEKVQKEIEVSLAGEQLRLRLHNSKQIRNRINNMFTYPCSFTAKDVVTWLIDYKEAPDRETAINIMQKFMEHNIIHHVCDQHSTFKDTKLLYRFRNDDGTLSPTTESRIMSRSKRIFEMMMTQEDSILKVREEGSKRYRRTFLGSQMLDWLMKHSLVNGRLDGETLCRGMLEQGIIQPVSGHYHFSDSNRVYQFCINFRRRRKLIEVLNETKPWLEPMQESPDSPFCLRKLGAELPQGSFVCAGDPQPEPPPLPKRPSCMVSEFYSLCSPPKAATSLPSVLKKPVTLEELLAPDAPYVRKTLSINSDAVGWGFIVRGTGPCHIQAVDPTGPAAASGAKVRQFIVTVNEIDCLDLDYRTIYNHIISGPKKLILEVLEPID
ncbi:DEP domain-containing mTOR-interacting protein-like [Rana temporaria]|uniref:DEP domain-containing mTOR-interacting protein-like n=1 Tax=Rana temporaria TaxID=8407 RepID=UPI001AAC9897|nr:DEP domain-containing mTOR-interacting protein-like [Rana temporaria]